MIRRIGEFSSVLFCSVLFCSVLFCSILFCSVLFCSVLFCSVLFCSILFCQPHQQLFTRLNSKIVRLVEFAYLVFTRKTGESYRRRLRSLLLCLCVTSFER